LTASDGRGYGTDAVFHVLNRHSLKPMNSIYIINCRCYWAQLTSSSFRATWWRHQNTKSMFDWGGGVISVVLGHSSTCLRCGTTSSCQSAGTSKIVKRCCSRVHSC